MEKKNQGIQSVEQAFDIIDFFANQTTAISLGDASVKMNIAKSKLHKYLASLLRTGVVVQDPNGNYYNGSKLLTLASKILGQTDIIKHCEPELQRLRLETSEAIALAIWSTEGPLIIRFLESPLPVAINFKVGFHAPLIDSAVGKCFAAFLPEQAYHHLLINELNELQLVAFNTALTKTKKLGYATRHKINSKIPGSKSIAAPIFDATGEMVASILVIGFEQKKEIEAKEIQLLQQSSHIISQSLGFSFQ